MKTPLHEQLLDLLFPPRCPFCGAAGAGDFCCAACGARLRLPLTESCHTVGELPIYSCYRYSGQARGALYALKFNGKRWLADPLSGAMAQLLEQHPAAGQLDCVCWVPMPPLRERGRGYNQAELLACGVAKRLGLPSGDCGLLRTGAVAQHDLHLSMRQKQQSAGFGIAPGAAPPPHVLLVDDLCTSGNSLWRCAELLRQAGAQSVTALTAFRDE